jgi:hypothetical protein
MTKFFWKILYAVFCIVILAAIVTIAYNIVIMHGWVQ